MEKKFNKIVVFSLIIFSSIFSSCSDTCERSGCKNKATGWKHYSDKSDSEFGTCIGCCRDTNHGGYCSKNCCAEDQ